jgi:hypothetical protein
MCYIAVRRSKITSITCLPDDSIGFKDLYQARFYPRFFELYFYQGPLSRDTEWSTMLLKYLLAPREAEEKLLLA